MGARRTTGGASCRRGSRTSWSSGAMTSASRTCPATPTGSWGTGRPTSTGSRPRASGSPTTTAIGTSTCPRCTASTSSSGTSTTSTPSPDAIRGQAGRWQSAYHDVIIQHDGQVGAMLDLLDELGIADDTIWVRTCAARLTRAPEALLLRLRRRRPHGRPLRQLEGRLPRAAGHRHAPDLGRAVRRAAGPQDLQPTDRPVRAGRPHVEHVLGLAARPRVGPGADPGLRRRDDGDPAGVPAQPGARQLHDQQGDGEAPSRRPVRLSRASQASVVVDAPARSGRSGASPMLPALRTPRLRSVADD
jgi:hypothetical protein